MKLNQKRLQNVGILAAAVVILQVVLSNWVYPFFGTTTQTLFSITPGTAITGTVGDKLLGFLTGIIPFNIGNLMGWVTVYLGAFVLLLVGFWVYDQKWAWKGRNLAQRIWAYLLYGTLALYAVLFVTKIEAVSVLAFPMAIGLAINYAIIAFVVAQLANNFKILRI